MRRLAALCVITALSSPVIAAPGILIKLAQSSQFTGAPGCNNTDTTSCCTSVGAAWYRYVGLKCIRDNLVQSYVGCADGLNFPQAGRIFTCGFTGAGADVWPPYVVYGVAAEFTVPATGAYAFQITAENKAIFLLDGKVLANGDSVYIGYAQATDMIGTVTTSDPVSRYTVSDVQLEQGAHKLEFMYFITSHTDSRFVVKWKTPDAAEFVPIPPEAFVGTPCNASCGVVAVGYDRATKTSRPVAIHTRRASGMVTVEGTFGPGAVATLHNAAGQLLARSTATSADRRRIALKTANLKGLALVTVTQPDGVTGSAACYLP